MTKVSTLEYASDHAKSGRLKNGVGVLLFVAAGLTAARLGAELAYRMLLFYGTYGGKPGHNHVGDGTFFMIYFWGVVGTLAAVTASLVIRRRFAWLIASGAIAANLVICVSFLVMHRTAALLEYGEWVRTYGP